MAIYLNEQSIGMVINIEEPLSRVIRCIDLQSKFVNTVEVISEEDYNEENIEIISNLLVLLVDGGD